MSTSSVALSSGKRKSNSNYDEIDNLVEILSKQFSFRESRRVENSIPRPSVPYIRPQNEYFQMRKIRESAKENGRISLHSARLAERIFARMISRQLWLEKIVFNRRAINQGSLVNYDQRDLMIIARRVAKRIISRRRQQEKLFSTAIEEIRRVSG